MDWFSTLTQCRALWKHDGNPKRPYALLTSKLISDGFVDCTPVMMQPRQLMRGIAHELAIKLSSVIPAKELTRTLVVGQMKGSVTLATMIAEELGAIFVFTEKVEERISYRMQLDPRFARFDFYGEHVVFVEDVVTTGGTTVSSKFALGKHMQGKTSHIASIVNRSGSPRLHDTPIVSCVETTFAQWSHDQNPYNPKGRELVNPVRPKGKNAEKLWSTL